MSGTTTSKNLGLVSAVKTAPTPPSNKNLVWIDTNTNPPKKKMFDVLSQSWLEVVFLPSPANIVKRLQTTTTEDVNINTYNIQNEDVFIKTISGDTYINLPTPIADFDGKTFEIINMSIDSKIFYNNPIRTINSQDLEQQTQSTNWKILCCRISGQFRWTLINKSSLV